MIDPTQVELPPLRDEQIELVLRERHSFDEPGFPPGYVFAIVRIATGEELGTVLLRVDERPSVIEFAGHIAYEIAPAHRGHGYAARACRLVRSLARRHLEVAWIMVSPDNPASMRTAERIAAEYVDTREVPEDSDLRGLGITHVRRYRWPLCHREKSARASAVRPRAN